MVSEIGGTMGLLTGFSIISGVEVIYFDTPAFERITKDRAAKFADMLSAIGGTMGLLTGFSIISGVEILYFAAKIIFSCIRNNRCPQAFSCAWWKGWFKPQNQTNQS